MAKKVKLRAFENPVPIASSNEAAPAKKKSRKASKNGTKKSTKTRTNPMAKLKRKVSKKGRKLTKAQKRARKAARTRKMNLQLKAIARKTRKRRKTTTAKRKTRRNPVVSLANPVRRRRPKRRTTARRRRTSSSTQRVMIPSATKTKRRSTKRRRSYASTKRRKTRRNPVALPNPKKRRSRTKVIYVATKPNPRRRKRYAKANPSRRSRRSGRRKSARRNPVRSRRNPAGNVIADVLTAFFFGALGYVIMRLVRDGVSWAGAAAGLDGQLGKDHKVSGTSTLAEDAKKQQKTHLMIHALLRTLIPVLLLVVTYKAVWERRGSNVRAQSIMQNMWLGAGVGTVLGTLEDWINVLTYGKTETDSIKTLRTLFRSNQALGKNFVENKEGSYPALAPLAHSNPVTFDTGEGYQAFGAVRRNPTLLDGGAGFQPFGAVRRNPTLLDGGAGFQAFGVAKSNPVVTDRAHGSFLDSFATGYMNKSYSNPNGDDALDMSALEDELASIGSGDSLGGAQQMLVAPNRAERNSISLTNTQGGLLASLDGGSGIDDF